MSYLGDKGLVQLTTDGWMAFPFFVVRLSKFTFVLISRSAGGITATLSDAVGLLFNSTLLPLLLLRFKFVCIFVIGKKAAKENTSPHEKRLTQQEVPSMNPFCTLSIV